MEIFDLYDKNRQKTMHTMERGTSVPTGFYRMVVHIAIINSDGKMLIQQRQEDKKGWSGLWDFTVGGHVTSGETSCLGAQRELAEELGIEIDMSLVRPSFTINFDGGFDDYYILEKEIEISDIVLQKEEVQAVKWADREEILKMRENGEFIPYKKSLVDMLFEMKCSSGAHQ